MFDAIRKLLCGDRKPVQPQPARPDENETPADDALFCAFCDAWTPDVETAIKNDWIPSYWDGEVECCDDPVCPTCQAAKLRIDGESGELKLIISTGGS